MPAQLVRKGGHTRRADEIPNDVTVHLFLKPEGPRLRLLVRVPMSAMRDVDYSKNAAGYFDLEKSDVPLRTAAKMWIGDNIQLFEEEMRLPEPTIVATVKPVMTVAKALPPRPGP